MLGIPSDVETPGKIYRTKIHSPDGVLHIQSSIKFGDSAWDKDTDPESGIFKDVLKALKEKQD